MSNEVKRYDPINSDGTCGMCIEDADYGAYVEYADYAALEAELATVKKVAYGNMELLEENAKLRAQLERLPVDGWKLVPVEPTEAMKIAGNNAGFWCVDTYRAMLAAAPAAPKDDDPVKVQLLEALEELMYARTDKAEALATAAIAAARQEGKV